MSVTDGGPWTRPLSEVDMDDVPDVGGKNASLGEMMGKLAGAGVPVPPGFATTARAYRAFLREGRLEEPLAERLGRLRRREEPLERVGAAIRESFLSAPLPAALAEAVRTAYRDLAAAAGDHDLPVAVRSSATAEDLPEASFAGQQESFLNVRGEDALLDACRRCFASLYTDRAIAYREELGFDHLRVALSVGVQRMVDASEGAAGVLFTLDPDTGFPDVAVIDAAFGLGESVVKGSVDPDRYVVFKPLLVRPAARPVVDVRLGDKEEMVVAAEGSAGGTRTIPTPEGRRRARALDDDDVLRLARWGAAIEDHYGRAMDVEWARDGRTGELWVLQARPETVQGGRETVLERFTLRSVAPEPLVVGAAVGTSVATGPVRRVDDVAGVADFPAGSVLVAERTDPDWGPALDRAVAVVTDRGGRTSHAAIVSRERGIPAVVGTGNGTRVLEPGREVTVSCAEGERGLVYAGRVEFDREEIRVADLPDVALPVMMNLGDPGAAFRHWQLPARGVGLARIEFVVAERVRAHPMALLHPERIGDPAVRAEIEGLVRGFADPAEYFVHHLATGIAPIAAAAWPHAAIVRTSDFKTNEYAGLPGGRFFERTEPNPMLGLRGASRYDSDAYREAFRLECRALRRVREVMGLDNVIPMIPFCRTLDEADRVLALMAEEGLVRGERGLEIYVMCEVPSNVVLADRFSRRFDGFSIGSNDLTQLVLGVDRDNGELAELFDESDEAVTRMIESVIAEAHHHGRTVGFCGQAPSDDPEYAAWLLTAGIDSVSVDPHGIPRTLEALARAEAELAATSQPETADGTSRPLLTGAGP